MEQPKIRTVEEILSQIQIYKEAQVRYDRLSKRYPYDQDYKREMFGYASRIFALEWVLYFNERSLDAGQITLSQDDIDGTDPFKNM